MADQAIFLIQSGKQTVLHPEPYEKEDLLQQLLARHPDVLAGGTTEGGEAKRLLLVKREMGIPTHEGGTSTFSLDHLFLDDQGVPVVVEVKRSSNKEIRRKVVGQMLDYAANATRYWPIPDLRSSLDTLQAEEGESDMTGDDAIKEFIGPEGEVDEFWKSVESNLRSGRIRMIFVADELPDELVRIIEFLNEQMNPAEVLGVEVPQYLGGNDVQVLVPRLVGATKAAVDVKNPAAGDYWTRERFVEVSAERTGEEVATLFDRLFDQVETHHGRLSWGRGQSPGVSGWFSLDNKLRPVWNATTGPGGPASHPTLYFYFEELQTRVPHRLVEAMRFLEQIRQFRPGLDRARRVGFTGPGSFPSLRLDQLVTAKEDVDTLFAAIDSVIDQPEVADG